MYLGSLQSDKDKALFSAYMPGVFIRQNKVLLGVCLAGAYGCGGSNGCIPGTCILYLNDVHA